MILSEESGDGSQWCPPENPIWIEDRVDQRRLSIRTSRSDDRINAFKEPKSSFINLAPSILRFPYNEPRLHNQRLTLWNRSMNAIKIRLKSPDPDIFLIHVEGREPGPLHQILLYGVAAKTILITCRPGRYKMAKSTLSLFLYSSQNESESLELPLEIYPSTAWFSLPKTIVIPEVVVGRKAHAIITLPKPKHEEKFFVSFKPTFVPEEALTLTPMNGTIGGENGIKQLKVTYAPIEYTTLSCTIKVYFPGLSSTTPHEIQILGRCKPGKEADSIRKEVKEIETFRPKPTKRKKKNPRIKFKNILMESELDQLSTYNVAVAGRRMSDLFTLAGVMRFMLRKGTAEVYQEEAKRRSGVHVLHTHQELGHHDKVKIYHAIKEKFGLVFEKDDEETFKARLRKLKTSERKNWEELQRLVGLPLFGKEEALPELTDFDQEHEHEHHHHEHHHHDHHKRTGRHSRSSVASTGGSFSMKAQKSISEEEKRMYRNIIDEVPKDFSPKQKFVQLALTVITRWRADRRIAKLRVLIDETRKTNRRKSSTKRNSLTVGHNHGAGKKSHHVMYDLDRKSLDGSHNNDSKENHANHKEDHHEKRATILKARPSAAASHNDDHSRTRKNSNSSNDKNGNDT